MRKTKEVTIGPDGGRDAGKRFLITEMSAAKAEKWAHRALAAMARSGLEIPEHITRMGMAGVIAMGMKALLGADFRDAEPLMDEMFECIKSVQPAMPQGRALVEDDTEEVATRLLLRSEVLELHAGFSVAAFLSKIWESAAQRINEGMQNTPTSSDESEPSSRLN
jgi:hypothetical protein